MKRFLILALALGFIPTNLPASEIRFEGGLFSTASNRLNIPNPGGSRVLVKNDALKPYGRLQGHIQVSKHGYLKVLVAPLQTDYSYQSTNATTFNGVIFPAGSAIEVTYRFNSYRLGFLYEFPVSESFKFYAGILGKIRQAKIALRSGGQNSTYSNTGFVPLLNLGFRWQVGGPWDLRFDLDGAAAKQGRAFDGAVELFYALTPEGTGLSAGYRVLEGGAENDKVNTFTLIHYALVAATFSI